MNWTLLLKEWDGQRRSMLRQSLHPIGRERGVFICRVADRLDIWHPVSSMQRQVELALTRDDIRLGGDGFDDRHWPFTYLKGPEYIGNDRRRAWLVWQVEKETTFKEHNDNS